MKERVKQQLEEVFKTLKEVIDFCNERKHLDGKALELITDILNSPMSLLTFFREFYDKLVFSSVEGNEDKDLYNEVGYQILRQTQFIFIGILSVIEYKTKEIIVSSNQSPLKVFLKREKLLSLFNELFDLTKLKSTVDIGKEERFEKFIKCLKNEPPIKSFREVLFQSEKNKLISNLELQEWSFFLAIRNAMVHNNAIPSEDLECVIYGKKYFYKKNETMSSKQLSDYAFFIKRITEIFFNWSQNHTKAVVS